MAAAKIGTVGTIATAAMSSTPAVPKPILATVTLFVTVRAGILLRLAAARNECRKATDILSTFMAALVGLRIGLLLTLMLLMLLILLMLLGAVVHLLITRRKWLRITRQIGLLLRLARRVARLVLSHEGLVIVILPIKTVVVAGLLRLAAGSAALLMWLLLIVVRVLLTKLFLRCGNQAEVVFGVLIIILGGHGVARSLCVTRELNVLFRNM